MSEHPPLISFKPNSGTGDIPNKNCYGTRHVSIQENLCPKLGLYEAEERHSVTVKRGGVDVPHIKPERVSYIEERIHSWRKANQIHRWFVENVQGGLDNCEEYFVSRDNLKELLQECKRTLENKESASGILPTTSGCFFGSTEYDEFYFQDIIETADMLEKLLEEEPENECDFYYRSSW